MNKFTIIYAIAFSYSHANTCLEYLKSQTFTYSQKQDSTLFYDTFTDNTEKRYIYFDQNQKTLFQKEPWFEKPISYKLNQHSKDNFEYTSEPNEIIKKYSIFEILTENGITINNGPSTTFIDLKNLSIKTPFNLIKCKDAYSTCRCINTEISTNKTSITSTTLNGKVIKTEHPYPSVSRNKNDMMGSIRNFAPKIKIIIDKFHEFRLYGSQIQVRMAISSSGKVIDATIIKSTTNNKDFDIEFQNLILDSLNFGSIEQNETITITIPFNFDN